MITIKIDETGFEISGHTETRICAAMSALSWVIGKEIYEQNDTTVAEANDGFMKVEIGAPNRHSNYLIDMFRRRLKELCDGEWKDKVVMQV